MSGKRLGLALGGGGAAGMSHIGVLECLEEIGIVPDLIVGSSIGAVIGGLFAMVPDAKQLRPRVREILATEEVSRRLHDVSGEEELAGKGLGRDLLSFFHKQLAGIKAVNSPALRSMEDLADVLQVVFSDAEVEEAAIEFAAVALDIVTGREIPLSTGKMSQAIYASAAIPGIFPPLRSGERVFVDGGFSSDCPIGVARQLGADYVIAVQIRHDLSSFAADSCAIEILTRTDEIARRKLAKLEAEQADLLVAVEVKNRLWADFTDWEAVADAGYRAAVATKTELRQLSNLCSGGTLRRLWARLGLS